MVAASKLRGAQKILDSAREFQASVNELSFEPSEKSMPETQLFVGMTSDRGLCGGINSSICRAVRDSILVSREAGSANTKIVTIGEKGKQGLERAFGQYFAATITETAKFRACTFKQCGELIDIVNAIPHDKCSIFFQQFKNMMSYITTETPFFPYDSYKDELPVRLAEYEIEGDPDTMLNLSEFRGAVNLFHFFAENEASTLSARMSAMDNSSNNARDMIDSLTLMLNRNRQAKITTEISEIISGSAAVDDAA